MTRRMQKLIAYSAAIAVLGGVFALYTRPTVLVTIADQVWACFN
jgi:hypothetical protein